MASTFIHTIIKNVIKFNCHVMIYITQTFGKKTQVCGFTPYEQIETYIQEFTAYEIGAVAIGKTNLRSFTQVRAPGTVIFQELDAKAP